MNSRGAIEGACGLRMDSVRPPVAFINPQDSSIIYAIIGRINTNSSRMLLHSFCTKFLMRINIFYGCGDNWRRRDEEIITFLAVELFQS